MEFGRVENPEQVDFAIPQDHPETVKVLRSSVLKGPDMEVYVGCAKWNRKDLKDFYPRGIKDELAYYSTQFNSIELNATFYRLFPPSMFDKWRATVPETFRFFPKLEQTISHFQRLKEVQGAVEQNIRNMMHLQDKLKMVFLQMPDSFAPKDFDRVVTFVKHWSYEIPLAIELRHAEWYKDPGISSELYDLLEGGRITHILVDTAGRRDLMHVRLTTPTAFIRWVGANNPRSDRSRLEEWIDRIFQWREAGLQQLFFFIHQNAEQESPALAAYFIERLNRRLGTTLPVPRTLETKGLFDELEA